eukprot:GHVU01236374.1.p1 GENE.GHVU01236374.1~~GHVU01236374.1.p1  ORF type:complete len:866 (+),score=77.42 GHVU01236374.1:277-2598(+)
MHDEKPKDTSDMDKIMSFSTDESLQCQDFDNVPEMEFKLLDPTQCNQRVNAHELFPCTPQTTGLVTSKIPENRSGNVTEDLDDVSWFFDDDPEEEMLKHLHLLSKSIPPVTSTAMQPSQEKYNGETELDQNGVNCKSRFSSIADTNSSESSDDEFSSCFEDKPFVQNCPVLNKANAGLDSYPCDENLTGGMKAAFDNFSVNECEIYNSDLTMEAKSNASQPVKEALSVMLNQSRHFKDIDTTVKQLNSEVTSQIGIKGLDKNTLTLTNCNKDKATPTNVSTETSERSKIEKMLSQVKQKTNKGKIKEDMIFSRHSNMQATSSFPEHSTNKFVKGNYIESTGFVRERTVTVLDVNRKPHLHPNHVLENTVVSLENEVELENSSNCRKFCSCWSKVTVDNFLQQLVNHVCPDQDSEAALLCSALARLTENYSTSGLISEEVLSRLHIVGLGGVSRDNSSCVPGIVLPVSSEQVYIANGAIQRKALFINGDLTSSYSHVGYKKTVETKPTVKLSKSVTTAPWIEEVCQCLQKLGVKMLACRGTACDDIKDLCVSEDILLISSVPYHALQALSYSTGCSMLSYVTDCTQNDVGQVTVEPLCDVWQDQLHSGVGHGYVVIYPDTVSLMTIVACHPSVQWVQHIEESLWHGLYKLQGILTDGKLLAGAGLTELHCASLLVQKAEEYQTESSGLTSEVLKAVAQGFTGYQLLVQANTQYNDVWQTSARERNDTRQHLCCVFDDCRSKLAAWQSAVDILCTIIQSDLEIVTGLSDMDISHL